MTKPEDSMFGLFDDGARRAVVLAQETAHALHLPAIEPAHLLVALCEENNGVAGLVLRAQGLSAAYMKASLPVGDATAATHLPFTERTKRLLERSGREAQELEHGHIGTEHILLAMCRVLEEGWAGYETLAEWLPVPAATRTAVIEKIASYPKGKLYDPPDVRAELVKLLTDILGDLNQAWLVVEWLDITPATAYDAIHVKRETKPDGVPLFRIGALEADS